METSEIHYPSCRGVRYVQGVRRMLYLDVCGKSPVSSQSVIPGQTTGEMASTPPASDERRGAGNAALRGTLGVLFYVLVRLCGEL
ncbi:hypothetical protein RRG08_001602 [Elysia crispata]|uniref:Uncharacterized protein n=1 Tax=Elysia crispata TaxID=231223 RepID=A0AAE1E073_9GAST|nr:hypothetical protein RRG08_001602 [Elysia crispata]